jgi:two-component SAPR family response regulator
MKTLRILIVEDEPLVAAALEIMSPRLSRLIMVEASVAATKKMLHDAVDFAFLDVNVTDGKTFEIAQMLECKHVPFVFVSARRKNSCLPPCEPRLSFPRCVR